MEGKPLSIDILALKLSTDVVDYVRNWMRGLDADDLDFHKYRMRLLSSLNSANSVTEKLTMLLTKTSSRLKFEALETISDKVMGESISRYIFAKIMVALNDEYRKILDHEMDRVKSEIGVLQQRTSELKIKIEHH